MFVTLDISIVKTGEGLLERLDIRVLSFSQKQNCLKLKHGKFCWLRDGYPIFWWFWFGKFNLVKNWAQIWSQVLPIKVSIFRGFMQLNELQCLEPDFKSWPLCFKKLFREDTINDHEP